MDARRLELYELLKPKLDEEPARALVLALPADPDRLATKDDLLGVEERIDARFDAFEARMDARFESFEARMDARFAQIDGRFGQMDGRFGQMDGRFGQMEATLTRRMVTIMGAWTILVGSTVGWVAAILR